MKPEHHLFSPARPPATGTYPAAPEPVSEGPMRRRFFWAPPTVSGLLASLLDPAVMVLTLWALQVAHQPQFSRWVMALSLLVILLAYPGRTPFGRSGSALALDIAANWVLLVLVVLLCVWVTRSAADLNWTVFTQWVLLTPVVQLLAACALRAAARWQAQRGAATRPVVLVGGDTLALRTTQALAQLQGPRRRVVGYFDDRCPARLPQRADAQHLGGLADAARYVDKLGIREVYITLPMASQARMAALLAALQGTTASLFFVPDVLGTHIVQGRLQDVNGLPVVGICETPFTGVDALLKRGTDLVLGSVLLVLALPLLLLLSVAIRLESQGPVWQRQRRCGLDGEEITILSFRTTLWAEAGCGTAATRVGRWLQSLHLVRLPQLLNVLQGRLSLVGPQPHTMAQHALWRQQIRAYMVRHKARPGITGWAQLQTPAGEGHSVEAMQSRLALDLYYLQNWSLGLDLHILLCALRGGSIAQPAAAQARAPVRS